MKSFVSLLLCALLVSLCVVPASAIRFEETVVLAYGDSVTASGAWFSAAEEALGIKIQNMGEGGRNSLDGRQAFMSVVNRKPDILLLSFGINDAALDMAKHVPVDTYVQTMRAMIVRAQKEGMRVILVIENPLDDTLYFTRHDAAVFEPYGGANAYYEQYVHAARDLAEEYDLVYADLYRIFMEQEDYTALLSDGVHPNEEGYKLYADALTDALVRLDLGDVNLDGRCNTADYMLLKRYVMGLPANIFETYADINRDGKIGIADYVLLKRHVMKTHVIERNP